MTLEWIHSTFTTRKTTVAVESQVLTYTTIQLLLYWGLTKQPTWTFHAKTTKTMTVGMFSYKLPLKKLEVEKCLNYKKNKKIMDIHYNFATSPTYRNFDVHCYHFLMCQLFYCHSWKCHIRLGIM